MIFLKPANIWIRGIPIPLSSGAGIKSPKPFRRQQNHDSFAFDPVSTCLLGVVQNPRTYRLGSHNFPYDSCVDKYRHTYNQSASCCRIHFPATSMSAVVSSSATAKLTPKVSLRNPRTRLLWTPSPCRVARRKVAAKAEVTNGNGA